jgi:hypothetical protein
MPRQQNSILRLGTIAICVVAGAWTIFHIIWELGKNTADDYWGPALLVLFILALILAFFTFFQERGTLLASTPQEQFPEPAIARFFFGSAGAAAMWFVVRMNVGAEWFASGWEKVTDPTWGTSGTALAGFVKGAISKTGGDHPSVQGWYGNFLKDFVLPNAGLFSFLVTWGELAVGLGILLRAVPVFLLASLWPHRAGPLAPAHVGIALEARIALPRARGRRSVVHCVTHCDVSCCT